MLPPKTNTQKRINHRGAAEESVVGRWFYGIVIDDTTPESDQQAAEIATNRAFGQTRHGLKATGVVLAFLHTNYPDASSGPDIRAGELDRTLVTLTLGLALWNAQAQPPMFIQLVVTGSAVSVVLMVSLQRSGRPN